MTSAAINYSDIHISGDVRIDPRAVISSGVILQAAPNSYIAIAAGACIGAGSILQAHQGNIEIQSGAIIGAGTIIIGKANIGENVCIGYGTTIFRASIIAAMILPPNTLIGDVSRQSDSKTTQPKVFQQVSSRTEPTTFDPWQEDIPKTKIPDPIPTTPIVQPTDVFPPTPVTQPIEAPLPTPAENPEIIDIPQELESDIISPCLESIEETQKSKSKVPVVGQVYINQLLMTLFPHQNPIKPTNDSSPT